MNLEEVYSKLPSSWKELKLKDYIKLSAIEVKESDSLFTGLDNHSHVLATLGGVSVEEINQLALAEHLALSKKISFIGVPPVPEKKSLIKCKAIDKITYDNYLTYLQHQKDQFNNLHKIIKAFAETELSEEEVNELDMVTIRSFFLSSHQRVKKYLKRLISYQKKRLLKQKLLKLIPFKRKTLKQEKESILL